MTAPAWRTSSYTYGGNCVEVTARSTVLVRDSKNPDGAVLRIAPDAWRRFTRRLK